LANVAVASNAGHKFRRSVPIGRSIAPTLTLPRLRGREGGCHEARLIAEIDGDQHDLSSHREAERAEFLQNEGYRILRFWNNEILVDLDGVHYTIADALAGSPPPSSPPSMGESSVNASRRNPVSTEAAEKIEAETTLRRQLAYVMISD